MVYRTPTKPKVRVRNPLPEVMRKYHKPSVVKAKRGKGSYVRKLKHKETE